MTTSVKEQVRELVEHLPPGVHWDAVLDAVELSRKVARGLADGDAGRHPTLYQVRQRFGIAE